MHIGNNNEIENVFEKLFTNKSPQFLEVVIKPENKALPKLSVNRPIEDQEPLLTIDELKSNMYIDLLGRNTPNED